VNAVHCDYPDDGRSKLRHCLCGVGVQVHLFALAAASRPFNEDVVRLAALPALRIAKPLSARTCVKALPANYQPSSASETSGVLRRKQGMRRPFDAERDLYGGDSLHAALSRHHSLHADGR